MEISNNGKPEHPEAILQRYVKHLRMEGFSTEEIFEAFEKVLKDTGGEESVKLFRETVSRAKPQGNN